MSNNLESDGSSALGVREFFKKTNRYQAREWEDEYTWSHVDPEKGIVKDSISEERACPICSTDARTTLFNKQGFLHHKCKACLTIYVSPSLTKKDFYNLWYGENSPYPFLDIVNSESQKSFDRTRFNYVLSELKKIQPEGTLLDIGAGGGFFLELSGHHGWVVEGIDVYRRAVDFAQSKGVNVIHGDFCKDLYAGKKFNIITLWEVIDLVPEPMSLIDDAITLLKSDGILGLSYRNAYSLAAMILHEKCNVFLGSAHFQLMSYDTIVSLMKSKGMELCWSEGYISEAKIINNFMNYEAPYEGNMVNNELSQIFCEDFIHKNRLSYKFSMLFKKIG